MVGAAGRRRRARPVERALPPPAPGAAFQDGLYIPLDQVDIAESGGAAAVLNGNLAISWVDSTFEGALLDDEEQLESARAGVALRGAVTLELAVDAGADTAGLLRLAMLPLPPIEAGPIEISPFVEVRLHRPAHGHRGRSRRRAGHRHLARHDHRGRSQRGGGQRRGGDRRRLGVPGPGRIA